MKPFSLLLLSSVVFVLASCGSTKSVSTDPREEKVNWGYGEVDKSKTAKSVDRLVVKENEVCQYANMYDYLQSRVPGVNVEGNRIIIRGVTSIYGPTDPLLIVNGAPVSDLDFLNPQDVSTVDVLKGPEASIYGTDGANGVLIITTKKGNE